MLESNPFMNLSWEITATERIKCALFGPLLIPPRIALVLSCLFSAYFWARLSMIGGVDLNKPLPYWRLMVRMDGVAMGWVGLSCAWNCRNVDPLIGGLTCMHMTHTINRSIDSSSGP